MRNLMRQPQWPVSSAFPEEIRQAFNQFFNENDGDGSSVVTSQWAPRVDIKEESDRFVILADLPGIDPSEVEVLMDKGTRSEEEVKQIPIVWSGGTDGVISPHATIFATVPPEVAIATDEPRISVGFAMSEVLLPEGALHMHSAMARNVVGGEWCMGTAGGFTHRGYLEYTRSADVVLILGASFNAFQSRGGGLFAPDATIAHVVLEEHPSSLPVGLRVLADVGSAVPRLVDSVRELRDASAPTWRNAIGSLPPAEDRATQPELFHDYGADGRLDPRAALRRLNGMMPAQRTVCTDGGHFLGWVPMYLDSPDPHSQVLVGTAIQTIGLGFPTAIGVAAARPDDFNVLVTGDGGGLMAMAEAETVFRTVRRGAVIVMNDAAYGAELHQYRAEGLDTASMVIDDIDFAAMGRSLGARGVTVATVADFALVAEELAAMDAAGDGVDGDAAAGNSGVLVIDLKISREVIADFIAEVLKKQ